MKQENHREWEAFIKEIKAKGIMCLPAAYVAEARKGKYELEVRVDEKEACLQLKDYREYITEMPYIKLSELYEECGRKFDSKTAMKCLKEYIKRYEEAIEKEQKVQDYLAGLINRFPKERIFTMLVPMSKEAKERFPGRERGSAYQIYAVCLDENRMEGRKRGIVNSLVTTELMKQWSIDEDTLFLAAKEFMPALFPYHIQKIPLWLDENIYVIGTIYHSFGTGTLLYKESPLKELAMELACNLILFPLSVHEAVVFPDGEFFSKEDISNLAKEVSPFGKEIWYYNRKGCCIAFSERERLDQEIQLKDGIIDVAERRRSDADFG